MSAAWPLDQLGRGLETLRISLIDRCNFRCPYCMPESDYPREHAFLRAQERLSFAEIVRLARVVHSLGVRKIRLTGGEPLLRKDVANLVRQLKTIPELKIALTTNASLLAEHADALYAAGLDQLTVSLDSVDPDRFRHMSGGRGELTTVLDGLAAAEAAGFRAIKINCVVQRDVNEQDVLPLVAHFRHTGHIVRFIEYMDVGSCNRWQAKDVVSTTDLLARIDAVYPLSALATQASETATRYSLQDGSAELGFVASVTKPFCRGCTRARVSADGQLHLCLFSNQGIDLKASLRDAALPDVELKNQLAAIWQQRTDRYSELRQSKAETSDVPDVKNEVSVPLSTLKARGTAAARKRIEMYQIGG